LTLWAIGLLGLPGGFFGTDHLVVLGLASTVFDKLGTFRTAFAVFILLR
jgi:hypothetical protein